MSGHDFKGIADFMAFLGEVQKKQGADLREGLTQAAVLVEGKANALLAADEVGRFSHRVENEDGESRVVIGSSDVALAQAELGSADHAPQAVLGQALAEVAPQVVAILGEAMMKSLG